MPIIQITKQNVKVELEVPLKRISDLICCGMEGGIGYWACIVGYKEPTKLEVTTYTLDGEKEGKVYRHIDYLLNPGGTVILEDSETEDDFGNPVRYNLTHEMCLRGLEIMAAKYPRHFANFMQDNEDAETGDVFIQCSVFGQLVYG
jgi:hypothetical protein